MSTRKLAAGVSRRIRFCLLAAAGAFMPSLLQAQTVVFASAPPVDFASANVCPSGQTTPAPCSQSQTLSYNVTAATTVSAVNVLTIGSPNLDFTLGSSICPGSKTGGNACTVQVAFTPLAPGLRKGAVQLADSSGNVLVTTFVYGLGQGPARPSIQATRSRYKAGCVIAPWH